jgi:hypothetical protein
VSEKDSKIAELVQNSGIVDLDKLADIVARAPGSGLVVHADDPEWLIIPPSIEVFTHSGAPRGVDDPARLTRIVDAFRDD